MSVRLPSAKTEPHPSAFVHLEISRRCVGGSFHFLPLLVGKNGIDNNGEQRKPTENETKPGKNNRSFLVVT